MKIKEFPKSLFKTINLVTIPSKNLSSSATPTLPIVVSLTTIESRLSKVSITIRSILTQSKRPEKILLWVNEDDRNKIPAKLKKLESHIFEIHFTKLKCSHKKLIHTLKLYPDYPIITCDDDFIYDKDWLSTTYNEYLKYPNVVIGNQTRTITYSEDQKLLPYKQWKSTNQKNNFKDSRVLPIGASGVLYPPNSLHTEVQNIELFLELCPNADDLWFKAMSHINGTISIQSKNTPKTPIPIAGTQSISLKKSNVALDKNRIQLQSIIDYFNITF